MVGAREFADSNTLHIWSIWSTSFVSIRAQTSRSVQQLRRSLQGAKLARLRVAHLRPNAEGEDRICRSRIGEEEKKGVCKARIDLTCAIPCPVVSALFVRRLLP